MKTAARALLTAAIAAMAAGAFSPPASAQTRQLNPREAGMRAAQEARLQRQEAAARKKGNYNAAFWSSKEREVATYWNKKGVH